MTSKTKAGCGHDAPAMPVADALARVLDTVTPLTESETLPIREALGRVLATDVRSRIDVPGHDNSAMDGYALNSRELVAGDPLTLSIVGTSFAGNPFTGHVGAGECIRIMTGAVMPAGADTVVMQEHVRQRNDTIEIEKRPAGGDNVRAAGEDIAAGSIALTAGAVLEPAHIGLLASIGNPEVEVLRRPRVAFFSTGDELCEVGSETTPGQIYDSNRYTLFGMLERLGVEIHDLGVVRDVREDLHAAFRNAAASADVVVTTGGVSVGDADLVGDLFEELGHMEFWSVAMKPGRPTVFGTLENALFFGLPGNPVSVMATFYQLAQPGILKLSGRNPAAGQLLVSATCRSRIRTRRGRTEFLRGILSRDESGEYVVDKTGHQGSGILSSMASANCFIVVREDQDDLEAGSSVQVQPFETFV